MSLVGAIGSIFSGSTKGIIEGVASAVDRFVETDAEKKAALLEVERVVTERMRIAEESARATVDARMQVIVAELKSGDQYVSRTRPMIARWGLYIILFNYCVVPAFSRAVAVFRPGDPVEALLAPFNLPLEFWVAWGGVVGVYAIGRSFEKQTGTATALSRLMTGNRPRVEMMDRP